MRIDEFLDELRMATAAGPGIGPPELQAIATRFVQADVEDGETYDQWVLLEVTEGGRELQISRFFEFGDQDEADLNDLGVVMRCAQPLGSGLSTSIMGSIRGAAPKAGRLDADDWLGMAHRELSKLTAPVDHIEVFG